MPDADTFLALWNDAAVTTLGLFWMAFWAFGLGYLISSMIQVFVSRPRMRKTMGGTGPQSVLLGTFFGFISSSCSFAALSTTRALFTKGAGFMPSLAFLLASTNLVIELGIVIAVFLGWQFVVGEYVGGIFLILICWLLVRLIKPGKLIESARERAKTHSETDADENIPDWKALIASLEGWRRVSLRYVMEWGMVWKDVTIGFTVAGVIAAFIPKSFFETLFIGSGGGDPSFWQVAAQTLIGPLAAFFTFIGSMGNIPLAAVLFENGVSFAGIMAFIFSDLVVLPVLRIQSKYYGMRMTGFILGLFLIAIFTTALLLHYGLAAANLLPLGETIGAVTDRKFFSLDYTLFLNSAFIGASLAFLVWKLKTVGLGDPVGNGLVERSLFVLAVLALFWLAAGLVIAPLL